MSDVPWKWIAGTAAVTAVATAALVLSLAGDGLRAERTRAARGPDERRERPEASDWGDFDDDRPSPTGAGRRRPVRDDGAREPTAETETREATELAAALADRGDAGALPAAVAECVARPDVRLYVEEEVLRRIAEREAEERAEREAERAIRRAEARTRLATIGVGDPELARLGPSICAMRERWRARENEVAPTPGAREEMRAAMTAVRAEVADVLGPERNAALEELGGGRIIARAIECPEPDSP